MNKTFAKTMEPRIRFIIQRICLKIVLDTKLFSIFYARFPAG